MASISAPIRLQHDFAGYDFYEFSLRVGVAHHGFNGILKVIGLIGGAGMVVGGYLTDKLTQRDERWIFWMPAAASILSVLALVAALLVSAAMLLCACSLVVPAILVFDCRNFHKRRSRQGRNEELSMFPAVRQSKRDAPEEEPTHQTAGRS